MENCKGHSGFKKAIADIEKKQDSLCVETKRLYKAIETKVANSGQPLKKFNWRVDINGELIYLWFGNVRVGFHFESGFKISQWLRLGAAQAKRFAGDTSKSIHASGRLTDGETNYKLGLE